MALLLRAGASLLRPWVSGSTLQHNLSNTLEHGSPFSPAWSFLQHMLHSGVAAQQQIEQPSPSTSSSAEPSEHYILRVATGNLRGAGTHSRVYLRLIGSQGCTTPYLIGGPELTPLQRGTIHSLDVAVPRDIGTLRRVHVEKHYDSLTDSGTGWFLKHVEIQGPQGDVQMFPCNNWLGASDCGGIVGPLERNLLPAIATQLSAIPAPVRVTGAGMSIPHPDKVKQGVKGVNRRGFGYGGEDAYFITEGKNGVYGMGVADGVYMWKELGIDSGAMSRDLMLTSQQMVAGGHEDVFKIMQQASRHTTQVGLEGSSTACLATINTNQGQLHAANLGDSGFLLLGPTSEGKLDIKLRTNQLEHEFGCPFQLGHHRYANSVEDADLVTHHVVPGDVLVMGTDGLFDNMGDSEIVREVQQCLTKGISPGEACRHLVKVAFEASMDRKRSTPYSRGATDAFDMVYSGGKPDDITVLVAYCS